MRFETSPDPSPLDPLDCSKPPDVFVGSGRGPYHALLFFVLECNARNNRGIYEAPFGYSVRNNVSMTGRGGVQNLNRWHVIFVFLRCFFAVSCTYLRPSSYNRFVHRVLHLLEAGE